MVHAPQGSKITHIVFIPTILLLSSDKFSGSHGTESLVQNKNAGSVACLSSFPVSELFDCSPEAGGHVNS